MYSSEFKGQEFNDLDKKVFEAGQPLITSFEALDPATQVELLPALFRYITIQMLETVRDEKTARDVAAEMHSCGSMMERRAMRIHMMDIPFEPSYEDDM